ncbi:MAG TPA: rhodanese-like domain-containing protein [Methanothrix sp.]|jgi:thiosulfate/3-mercaptopyruvate sulfurtransferase|uniref:sulfurtransferase n=1 Tax=Methanothrix sp. TaxID=90426 RepID=UPI002C7A53C2|nr:rhodanese-like domain-containing protein [Methanothrix sp.]MDI9417651.1 rhodanese-like domain-containing protein [Euryarchaeota archaeon]HON34837.1 rhodanese-like domain-containing protein [Methanothrix sp.]HRU75436.1 rhodanese-like domain-containing protein [Methanothrix sp.]
MRRLSDLSCSLLLPKEGKEAASARPAGSARAILALFMLLSIFSHLYLALLAGLASAGTESGEFCPDCPDWVNLDGWLDKKAAYEEDMKNGIRQNSSPAGNSSRAMDNASNSSNPGNSSNASHGPGGAVATPDSISPDEVILDISPSAPAYIEGAVNLNYDRFFSEGGEMLSAAEMARLLGDAGISSNDPLLIAGECLPCGGGPSPAFFTYWALKYLGHERVRVLEGTIDDWKAAGLNISNRPASRPRTEYLPHIRPELLATYEYVVAGGAQIVDARPKNAYELASIPGAVNIPYQGVLVNDSMKSVRELEGLFSNLDRNRTVVVYTNIGVEAALLWYALSVTGYDARLYTWRDWLESQPKFPYELIEASAQPNPVRSGSATTISASFRKRESAASQASADNSSATKEAKLTVKGCATCGFGSPQGFANLDRKDGYVQIGSTGRATQGSASANATSPSPGIGDGVRDGTLSCSAVIDGADGIEVARTSLLQTSGGRYMGVWNANISPGLYNVSIVASIGGNAKAFVDVLVVEVTGRG